MTDLAVAHGWPDGEARPLPFGPVLAQLNAGTIGGGGAVTVGTLQIGAWPALAASILTGNVPVLVTITWGYLGGAAAAPVSSFVHSGDGSVVAVPSLGHVITDLAIAGPAGTPLTYALMGSNVATRREPGTVRIVLGPDDAGSTEVSVYTVPQGVRSRIIRAQTSVLLAPDAANPPNYDVIMLQATGAPVSVVYQLAFAYPDRDNPWSPTLPSQTQYVWSSRQSEFDDGDSVDLSEVGGTKEVLVRLGKLDVDWLAPGSNVVLQHVRPGDAKSPTGTGIYPYVDPLPGDAMTDTSLHVLEVPV